jgi:RES domain-containing protein
MISIDHVHEPVLRVVRTSWTDPLDVSFSQQKVDNRWNTPTFPALYCCCSEPVAVAVAEDVLNYAGVVVADLQPEYRPQKVAISWSGHVVDVISEEGLKSIGLPSEYPVAVSKDRTRTLAEQWIGADEEGIVCRSASLSKKGFAGWVGSHEPWGELTIFTSAAKIAPKVVGRTDLEI